MQQNPNNLGCYTHKGYYVFYHSGHYNIKKWINGAVRAQANTLKEARELIEGYIKERENKSKRENVMLSKVVS
jgi:hypothetical protein